MRSNRILDALIPKTRQGILAATLLHPDRWWYASDLARHLRVRPSSLQRELASLVTAGILIRREEGRHVYYQPDPDCPILNELRSMLIKTVGLVDVLRDLLAPWRDSIACAFIYGSVARGEEHTGSDVDLMVIGEVGLADLSAPLRQAEQRLQRPVNPTVYKRREFATKLQTGNHFLDNVLQKDKLFLLGDPHELARLADTQPHSSAHHQQARTGQSPGGGGA